MTENTQEPPEFTAHADEMQWRGIYRDWALAGWTASRKQAMEEAASMADAMKPAGGRAWSEGQAAAFLCLDDLSASLRKEGKNHEQ